MSSGNIVNGNKLKPDYPNVLY